MKSTTSLMWTAAVFVSLAWAGQAKADIAPPPPSDFEETCTIEKQNLQQEDCTVCSTSYDDPERCYRDLSPDGYELFCKKGGDSSEEIWCRAVAPSKESSSGAGAGGEPSGNGGDSGDDADHKDGADDATTCSTVVVGGNPGMLGPVLCLAAAVLWMRRRGLAPRR